MNNRIQTSEYADELSANLLRIRLEANGINTEIKGKSVSDLYSGAGAVNLPVKLFVEDKDAEKAKEILGQYLKQNNDFTDYKGGHKCPFCGSCEIGPDPWKKWLILLTALSLGTLFCVLFWGKKYKCKECGYRW